MSRLRSKIVDQAKSWIGRKEADGGHKEIIDVYNSHTPLARSYKVKYTDEWCATFVSACAIKCGYTDIIPTECGCQKMIELFKKLGRWVENDAYVPAAGDVIFYDWQDSGAGDNVGHSDHVGIVEKVSGNSIVIIEGNYSTSVKRRTIMVNAKNIRGYGIPKYDAENKTESTPAPSKPAENKPATKKVIATDAAKSKDTNLAGMYVTTGRLNMRNGAGKHKRIMTVLDKGIKLRNYGFYTEFSGTKWLYVQATIDDAVYTGFCSINYLDKL